MKNFPLIILVWFIASCNQQNTSVTIDSYKEINLRLKAIIRASDSVVLISHLGPETLRIRDSVHKVDHKLVVDGKLNKTIIMERKSLSGNEIDELISILLKPTNADSVELLKCSNPEHAILIFKEDKLSYLNLDFSFCSGLGTSSDLSELKGYQKSKYKVLEEFFIKKGFNYIRY